MFDHSYYPIIIAFTLFCAFFTFFLSMLLIKIKKRQSEKRKMYLTALLKERERTMDAIAMELHDNVHQILQMLSVEFDIIKSEKVLGQPQIANAFRQAESFLKRLLYDTQKISHYLNPRYVQQVGLKAALTELEVWLNNTDRLKCTLYIKGRDTSLPDQSALMIFRVAQEAIQNVLKYASANVLIITLDYQPEHVRLIISDNGCGIAAQAGVSQGSGMENLRHRAALVNGVLDIVSEPDAGTTLHLLVPRSGIA